MKGECRMEWGKTGKHKYKCWVSDGDAGRRVVIWRQSTASIVKEQYSWWMECEGLCADEELQAKNSADAKKEALHLVYDAAIEEIQSLVDLVSKLSRGLG